VVVVGEMVGDVPGLYPLLVASRVVFDHRVIVVVVVVRQR
jgi:hypothetical protein